MCVTVKPNTGDIILNKFCTGEYYGVLYLPFRGEFITFTTIQQFMLYSTLLQYHGIFLEEYCRDLLECLRSVKILPDGNITAMQAEHINAILKQIIVRNEI